MVWDITRFFYLTKYPQEIGVLERLYQSSDYRGLRETAGRYLQEGKNCKKIELYARLGLKGDLKIQRKNIGN